MHRLSLPNGSFLRDNRLPDPLAQRQTRSSGTLTVARIDRACPSPRVTSLLEHTRCTELSHGDPDCRKVSVVHQLPTLSFRLQAARFCAETHTEYLRQAHDHGFNVLYPDR